MRLFSRLFITIFVISTLILGEAYCIETGSIKEILAGSYHSFVIMNDGTVLGTGENTKGQLGDNTTINKSVLTQVMNNVVSVFTGDSRTMFSKGDGILWGVGWNMNGELGDGTKRNTVIPVQLMSDVSAVSARFNHTMLIKSDGTLWGTGWNGYGQIGDGASGSKEYISTFKQVMNDAKYVTNGNAYTMVIKTDGTLWAIGSNGYGQFGNGTNIGSTTPVKIMDNVESVSAGYYHTMILKQDGTLWGTGNNKFGQLGDGTTVSKTMPTKIMDSVLSVSTGSYHSMILKMDGSLWAAGDNEYGQLGDGTSGGSGSDFDINIDKSTPVKIMDNVKTVSTGAVHTILLKNDGTIWGTGANDYGQLGDGTSIDKSVPVQINMPSTSINMKHSANKHDFVNVSLSSNQLSLFVPTTDQWNITVFTPVGRMIYQDNRQLTASQTTTVPLSEPLASGVYLVTLKSKTENIQQMKIVK